MRVRQSVVQSPSHDNDPTYSLSVWVGTVGGAALGTDPSPNVTPPAAGRILVLLPKDGALQLMGTARLAIVCATVAASSITLQPWFFDATQNLWIQYGPPITVTPTGAASNIGALTTFGNYSGAQVFVQITANTLVQAFAYEFM